LGRRYDLAQSLEVGEHITPSGARIFVDSIAPCRAIRPLRRRTARTGR
jgi:hypothetical protein